MWLLETDEHKSYINQSGNNTAMTDWVVLQSPITAGTVTTVNGKAGPTVVLRQDDIHDGSNYVRTHNDLN